MSGNLSGTTDFVLGDVPAVQPIYHNANPTLCDLTTQQDATVLSDELAITTLNNMEKGNDAQRKEPFGILDEARADGSEGQHDEDWVGQLSQNPLARAFNTIVPHGGLLSGMFNMASLTLGAGIISIPSAFNTSGVVMALIYLFVVTGLTVLSIALLATAMERTGLRSFEAMARGLFGRGGDLFVALLMWLLCFGGAVGYIIAVGEVLTPILHHENAPEFLQEDWGRRTLMIVIWILFMFPLVLPKQINSLRHVSAVGVCFIVFFVICVVIHSATHGLKNGVQDGIVYVRSGNDAISGLALFMFAYLCQVNAFKIYYEMHRPSVKKLTLQASLSCTMCCVLYLLVGIFGYLDIGPKLDGSILTYYNPYTSPMFFVCFIGLVVKLCAAFSLNMLACRTALFQVLRWDVDTMPYWKHTLISVSFAIGALILGLFVPDVNIVFGLAGAFCGGFIGFVFPALFVMYSGGWTLKSAGPLFFFSTYFLLLVGVIAIVWGTISSIYGTVLKFI